MDASISKNKKITLGFVCLFFLFFTLRLIVALAIDWNVEVAKDVEIYTLVAKSLLDGHGFVTEPDGPVQLHRAPLYPIVLAGVYALFGESNLTAVMILQVAFDAGTAMLVFWMGMKLFSKTAGIVSGVAYAIYPLSAYYTLRLLTESMFTLVLTATTALMVLAMSSNRSRNFLWLGIAGGVTALVRPIGLGLITLLAILILIEYRNDLSSGSRKIAWLVLGAALVISPWTARNYLLTGKLIPVSTGGGYALWIGNNLLSDGRDGGEIVDPDVLAAYDKQRKSILREFYPDEIANMDSGTVRVYPYISPEMDRAFARNAIKSIRENPLPSIQLMLKKFLRMWFGIFNPENRWALPLVVLMQGGLLALAVFGLVTAWKNGINISPFLLVIGYTALVHTLIVSTMRYSLPLVPLLMLFATVGVASLMGRRQLVFIHEKNYERQ